MICERGLIQCDPKGIALRDLPVVDFEKTALKAPARRCLTLFTVPTACVPSSYCHNWSVVLLQPPSALQRYRIAFYFLYLLVVLESMTDEYEKLKMMLSLGIS